MTTVKESLSAEQLVEIEAAGRKASEEKKAALRRRRRAGTKYGLLMERDNE
ncbi:hypothetical protein [Halobellus limi]|uniref:hypothetical protein n=1 Tax=Halobellus limi TaxID=699433 RepID=UPI00135BDD02|nr:hypothetical protein [Halobellus limi]